MSTTRHEIPTHLNVEDKAYFGMSVRQVLFLAVGASVAYGLWNGLPDLSLPLRLGVAAIVFLAFSVVALVRPGARPLEEWLLVAAHYGLAPKTATWRLSEPAGDRYLDGRVWEELSPEPVWAAGLRGDRLTRVGLGGESPR